MLEHFYEKLFDLFRTCTGKKKKVKQMTLNLHTANSNYRQDLKWLCLHSNLMVVFSLHRMGIYCTVDAKCKRLGNLLKFRHAYKNVFLTFHTYLQTENGFS